MGPTSGTVSDEGPEPLGVFAEVKPLHSTFAELQKLRHSSAIHFHYLFFKRVCLGYLPYPPSTDPCSRLACVGTVGLVTDLSRMFPLLSTVVRRMVESEATFEGDVSRCPSCPGTQHRKRLSSHQRCSIIAAPSARNFLVQRSRLSQLWGSPSESRPRSFPRLSRFCILSSLCPHPPPRTFV